MYEAMITAASGIRGQQRRLDVIADNMANVNTNGFKASRLNFKDTLHVAGGYPYADDEANQQKGYGVLTASISRIFSTGSMLTTGRDMDFAIHGDAFFEVMNKDGSISYTRVGNFYFSEVGGRNYLVTGNGDFILDNADAPITLPDGAHSMAVDTNGHITFKGDDDTAIDGGSLALRTFVNPDGLSSVGGCNYVVTEASGEALTATKFEIRQGVLENSNVDIAQEMTRLIRAQRAFSFASRALTTADQMEGIANNMRR